MDDVIRLRRDRLDWRAVEGEVIALDSVSSDYLGVNPTGAVLWRSIAEGATRASLVQLLESEGADPESATKDVDAFLASLKALGLLERSK